MTTQTLTDIINDLLPLSEDAAEPRILWHESPIPFTYTFLQGDDLMKFSSKEMDLKAKRREIERNLIKTLSQLRKRGMPYAETAKELIKKMQKKITPQMEKSPFSTNYRGLTAHGLINTAVKIQPDPSFLKITQEDWLCAIEYTMEEANADHLITGDTKKYVKDLEDHMGSVAVNALLAAAFRTAAEADRAAEDYSKELIVENLTRFMTPREKDDESDMAFIELLNEAIQNVGFVKKEDLEQANKSNEELTKNVEKLQRALDQEKSDRAAEYEKWNKERKTLIYDLSQEAKEAREETQAWREKCEMLEAVFSNMRKVEEGDDSVEIHEIDMSCPEIYDDEPLPDEGVIFLGGHQNLVKKVRGKHPKWTYVAPNDFQRSGYAQKAKIIFCWGANVSGNVFSNVTQGVGKGTPISYVTATNIDRLEREMKAGWYESSEALRSEGA